MQKRIKCVMRWMVLLLSLCCFTVFAKPPIHHASMNIKTIVVSPKNPTFTIKLPANPTTGFQWFLSGYTKQLIEPISATYIAPATKMPGAPGYMLWKFEVDEDAFIVPMVLSVKLVYMRSWTAESASVKIFKIVTQQ